MIKKSHESCPKYVTSSGNISRSTEAQVGASLIVSPLFYESTSASYSLVYPPL